MGQTNPKRPLFQFDGLLHQWCPPVGSSVATSEQVNFWPQLCAVTSAMEALEANSDSISEAFPGMQEKFQKWEVGFTDVS